MSDGLTIEVVDFALLSMLDRAVAGLENPKQLMQDIGAQLESNISQRFITKPASDGTALGTVSGGTTGQKAVITFIYDGGTSAGKFRATKAVAFA